MLFSPRCYLFSVVLLLLSLSLSGTARADAACAPWLDYQIKQLHGSQQINLCAATAGHPLLIVNTASHCGFTPQFEGLEALYQRYKDRGLVIIGFPSNDFNQEANSEEEVAKVCFYNFGVTFLMTEPVVVKGDNAHPVFQHLAQATSQPSWNFNKYLVSADGEVVEKFASKTDPESKKIQRALESILSSQ